jgi:hypothetical protein
MRREDTPEYPAVALREGLVNAVAHADYSKRGMQIMVAIYSDRMEIQNPGILPLGMTVEDIKDGVSRIRNPVIARVLRELDLMETWGSGYRRITEDCDQGGYPYPEWNELGSVVRITFPPHPDVSKGARPVGIGEHEDVQISVPINVQLNERQRWFLLNLQKGNQVRPIDIATRFEVSEKTARRDVKRLIGGRAGGRSCVNCICPRCFIRTTSRGGKRVGNAINATTSPIPILREPISPTAGSRNPSSASSRCLASWSRLTNTAKTSQREYSESIVIWIASRCSVSLLHDRGFSGHVP